MSGDPTVPTPTRRLLPRVTIGLSIVTIVGSVLLLGVLPALALGVVCLVLGVLSFRAARDDPSAQGLVRGAVAAGVTAFLTGIGWILIALVVSGLPAIGL